jgi:cell division protein ZapD
MAPLKHNTAMTETQRSALASPGAQANVYEQPLNERLRTFLRLDFLYSQSLYHNDKASSWGSRAAMASLLDMLAIATRGDVRSDVLKDLERHLAKLNEYQNHPGIDAARLRALMSNLLRLRADLSAAGMAWLQPLRDSEFLAAIKHRSAIPGGTCEFDLPDYYFWLNQPDEARMATFVRWQGLLRPLCDAIAELLWLTRQNGRSTSELARGGVFNINFDRDTPYQLLRVTLPAGAALYPEISGSHYRCSMRFLEWTDIDSRPRQTGVDVPFTLTCCP